MVKLVEEIIEGKRKKMNENLSNNRVPNDVVDILLNDGSHQVTDELIADNIIDMMIPGQDSVPILITLAIKYLSDCPLALQRLVVRVSYPLILYFLNVFLVKYHLGL